MKLHLIAFCESEKRLILEIACFQCSMWPPTLTRTCYKMNAKNKICFSWPGPASTIGRAFAYKSSDPSLTQPADEYFFHVVSEINTRLWFIQITLTIQATTVGQKVNLTFYSIAQKGHVARTKLALWHVRLDRWTHILIILYYATLQINTATYRNNISYKT